MKYFTILFIGVLFLCGCHKNNDEHTYYLKAAINGSPFVAESISYHVDTFSGRSNTNITGNSADMAVNLFVNDFNGTPGTYYIDSADASAYVSIGTNTPFAVSGSITITSVSPDLAGTFRFLCYDSTLVTEGVFKCAR